jgi:predicted secreted Zn-dependent protease
MKLNQALNAVREFLDEDRRHRERHRDAIKKVLRKLKAKEKQLASDAEAASSAGTTRLIKQKRQVVKAQRQKGVAALRALKRKP